MAAAKTKASRRRQNRVISNAAYMAAAAKCRRGESGSGGVKMAPAAGQRSAMALCLGKNMKANNVKI